MDMFAAGLKGLKSRTSKLTSQITKEFGKDDEQLRGDGEVDCVPLTPDGPVLIQYAVQNSTEGDREGSVFMLPTEVGSNVSVGSNLSVGLIKAYFPLPGCFHFRFKAASPDGAFGGFIWVDLEDSEPAPVFSGGISLKVLRLPGDVQTPARPRGPVSAPAFLTAPLLLRTPSFPGSDMGKGVPLDLSLDEPTAPSGWGSPAGEPPSHPVSPVPAPPPMHAAQAVQPAPPVHVPLQGASEAAPAKAPSPPPQPIQRANTLPIDLMEMDRGQPPISVNSGPVLASKPLNREELVSRREAEIENRVKKAHHDVIQRRQTEESLNETKREVGNKLRGELDAWAKTPDGASWKDIKVLLSKVDEVLWKDAGWKPVGLADLLQDGAIKKVYRKAIIIVHPDKMKEADSEVQIRAESIFHALNEAFKAFQEGGS